MRNVIFIFLLLGSSLVGVAQDHQFKQIGELGFGLGSLKYIGDLNPKLNLKFHRPAYSVFYRKNFHDEHLIVKTSLTFGSIKGDQSELADPLLKIQGQKFQSNLTELSAVLEYNFFNYRSMHDININRIHSPYLFFGGTVALVENIDDRPIVPSLVYGLGIKAMISHRWNAGCELGIRHTYIDNLEGLDQNELFVQDNRKDVYFHNQIYLSYSLFGSTCPEFGEVWKRK